MLSRFVRSRVTHSADLSCIVLAASLSSRLAPWQPASVADAAGTCGPVASLPTDIAASGAPDTAAIDIATFDAARLVEGCSTLLSIDATTFTNASPQTQKLSLFNAERRDRRLPTLQLDSSLMSQIDLNHSREMAAIPTPTGGQQLVQNSGFEAGLAPWIALSAQSHSVLTAGFAHTGSASAALCNYNRTSGWVHATVNLAPYLTGYKGQSVHVYFQGTTNASYSSRFSVDDATLTTS